MNTTSELEKCKNDIVYFIEHYTIDTNGNHIKLNSYQKEYLRYLQNNKLSNIDIQNINTNLYYINNRNTYRDKAYAYIRAYKQITGNKKYLR